MHPHKKSQGGALLTALFIMTLVAIVATAMSTRLQMDIYRTRLVITHDKLYLAAQAVPFWAMERLHAKKLPSVVLDTSGLVEPYPEKIQTLIPQIRITGGLYDLQARYNINNLLKKNYIVMFINLLGQTNPNLSGTEKNNLTLAVLDWLSNYDISRGNDLYSTYYLSQKPPYYPSHQLMNNVSELRLIKDMSAEQFVNIEPFVTALPETTPINLNTAPKEVLMSIGNGLSEAQTQELLMARGSQGFKDVKESAELLKKWNISEGQITLESQYFLSIALAETPEHRLRVSTLLHRSKDNKGKISVRILQQSYQAL